MLAIRGLAALLITTTAVLLLTCLHAIEAGMIVCCINHDRRVFRLSVFKVLMGADFWKEDRTYSNVFLMKIVQVKCALRINSNALQDIAFHSRGRATVRTTVAIHPTKTNTAEVSPDDDTGCWTVFFHFRLFRPSRYRCDERVNRRLSKYLMSSPLD